MTEQEAIICLKADKEYLVDMKICDGEEMDISINALEDIQQYREIGTVEKIKEELDRLRNDNECQGLYFTFEERQDLAREHKELEAYRSIGTVEECRAAVEKQIPKKPRLSMNEVSGMFVDYADGHGEYKTQTNNWWRCPCCDSVVGQRVIVHKRAHDQRKKKYCEDCGQAIDWSE